MAYVSQQFSPLYLPRYFVVCFLDAGYDFYGKKKKKKKKKKDQAPDPTSIREYCHEKGAVFCVPPKKSSEYAKIGEDGMIHIVEGDKDTIGLKSLQDNYREVLH